MTRLAPCNHLWQGSGTLGEGNVSIAYRTVCNMRIVCIPYETVKKVKTVIRRYTVLDGFCARLELDQCHCQLPIGTIHLGARRSRYR